MANPAEQELWRIYSFYSLHSDPTLPEQLKVPSFIRFAKDCQIISSKLKGAQIELEIARVARSRRAQVGGDYNPSTSLSFFEFLNILELLSQRVYTSCPPDVALRRLLLENVLLLASRRAPFSMSSEVKSPDAIKVVRETFAKPLQNIFDHYVHVCETRRNLIAASEVQRRNKERDGSGSAMSPSPMPSSQQQSKPFKDMISYKEYIQFCHDFSLRSTALLTAIQVGEIFLNCVALDPQTRCLKGMNFETFCFSIVNMAAMAYRDADPSISMHNKVKALLLFMWKHVNNREKIAEVARSRVRVLISTSGSLNLFGSGVFSDFFLAQWQAEGFPTYTDPVATTARENGAQFLKRVSAGHTKKESSEFKRDGPPSRSSESGGGGGGHGSSENSPRVGDGDSDGSAGLEEDGDEAAAARSHGHHGKSKGHRPVVIHGYQLAALFKKKPELAEFVFLEIENMKQHFTGRSSETL